MSTLNDLTNTFNQIDEKISNWRVKKNRIEFVPEVNPTKLINEFFDSFSEETEKIKIAIELRQLTSGEKYEIIKRWIRQLSIMEDKVAEQINHEGLQRLKERKLKKLKREKSS